MATLLKAPMAASKRTKGPLVCCDAHARTDANSLSHVASSIHGVVLLSGEFLEHNCRKACFKHGLMGFFEIRVPATGADLAMAHGPVPRALEIPRNPTFPGHVLPPGPAIPQAPR